MPVGCIRYSLRMGFKTLSFFCPVLGGPPGEAGSAPLRCADKYGVSFRRRTGSSVSLVGSFRVRGSQCPAEATPSPKPGGLRSKDVLSGGPRANALGFTAPLCSIFPPPSPRLQLFWKSYSNKHTHTHTHTHTVPSDERTGCSELVAYTSPAVA